MTYHKHKGYESNGVPKAHLVTQMHSDPSVMRWHNLSLGKKSTPAVTKATPSKYAPHWIEPLAPGVAVEDAMLIVNVPSLSSNLKGVRIHFEKVERGIRKRVILEIKK